ncbi:MAG: hemerythrin domain-containing protein [Candidatus Micrarchaeaceae archaeon]
MREEHDEEFNALEQFGKTGSRESFDTFNAGISRHIDFEEKVLFDIVRAKTGEKNPPLIEELALQHSRIRLLIKNIYELLGKENTRGMHGFISDLTELVRAHDSMEESDFYPWLDENMSDAEINAAFEKRKRIK